MTEFVPKKIYSQTSWGETLRQARLRQNWPIASVAKKLKIRASYLLALEEERLDKLPAGLYGRNFLKEYALLLKIDPREILPALGGDMSAPDNPFSQPIVKPSKFLIFPKIIRNILIALAILVCFLYLLFYFQKIFWPPRLEITSPAANAFIKGSSVIVSGQTDKEATVDINGVPVLNNHDGFFSQTVNLKSGVNNIVITAKKKNSRARTVIRPILAQ